MQPPEKSRSVPHQIGDLASWIVAQLREKGARVSPSSRLVHYERKFAENSYANIELHEPRKLLEVATAMRDITEIAAVLQCLPETKIEHLQRLVQDPPTTHLPGHSPGRDKQLELFIAATCKRAGLEVDLEREPDLWCKVGRIWIALAVKRLKSAKKFMKTIEDAAEQISKCPLAFGFVCIDTSVAWNPEAIAVVTRRSYKDIAASYMLRLNTLFAQHSERFATLLEKHPKVLGLLCIDHTTTLQHAEGMFHDMGSDFRMARTAERNKQRIQNAFRKSWVAHLPNRQEVKPEDVILSQGARDKLLSMRD